MYRGEYMINWSPGLQTDTSDLEVEMKQVKGKLYHSAYQVGRAVTSSVGRLAEAYLEQTEFSGWLKTPDGDFVVVATTRAETMFVDTAIAFNPEDGRYRDLAGKSATLPLVGRELGFIQDEVV